jgi:hypothetical protein
MRLSACAASATTTKRKPRRDLFYIEPCGLERIAQPVVGTVPGRYATGDVVVVKQQRSVEPRRHQPRVHEDYSAVGMDDPRDAGKSSGGPARHELNHTRINGQLPAAAKASNTLPNAERVTHGEEPTAVRARSIHHSRVSAFGFSSPRAKRKSRVGCRLAYDWTRWDPVSE